MEITYTSKLTCPECGFWERLEMTSDACEFFHTCSKCKALLKPKQGDCCVFCSYGDSPCPPIQIDRIGKHLETT